MALSWLLRLLKKSRPLSRSARRRTLTLEALEDRTVPSFLPPATLPVGVDPRAVTVADFNHDSKPDVAVVNLGSATSPSSVSVLLGNANGSFQPAAPTAVLNGGAGLSVAAGDFNGDGLPDVALTTAGSGTNPAVEVLLGKGDGSFQSNHLILPIASSSLSVTARHFDPHPPL